MTDTDSILSGKYSTIKTGQKEEPDATKNIDGCYYCSRLSCSCGNNEEYIKKLVACITEEVMNELGN
jgi:hypothetical protein